MTMTGRYLKRNYRRNKVKMLSPSSPRLLYHDTTHTETQGNKRIQKKWQKKKKRKSNYY